MGEAWLDEDLLAFVFAPFGGVVLEGVEPSCAAVVCAFELLPPEAVAEVLSALDEDAVVGAGGWLAGVDVLEEQGSPRMPRKSSFLEPPKTARKGAMPRLVSIFLLWLLLLLAAAPASAVMDVQPRNHAWEPPASSYDLAPDVRDGPNLYAYVKQNPWTGWDPHGLKVEVKRTPKAAPDAPKGMTKMQKTDWDRRQRETDHGSHTEITVRAALLDETSGGHTPEQLESMRQSIVDSVNKTFTGAEGKNSWSMKLDLRIVKSAKDIKDDDHELILKDFVMAKNFAGSEFGGYALRSDRQTESGSLGLGGNSLVLSMNSINNNGLKLGPVSAHEFGHSMGLRHPDDKMNKFSRSTYSKDNLMWHKVPGSPEPVSKKQIDSIYGDYSEGRLNQGRSSISEVDFYFSEQQYQKEKQNQGGQP